MSLVASPKSPFEQEAPDSTSLQEALSKEMGNVGGKPREHSPVKDTAALATGSPSKQPQLQHQQQQAMNSPAKAATSRDPCRSPADRGPQGQGSQQQATAGSNQGTHPAAASPIHRAAPSSAAGKHVVILWDLDETLITFQSLLNGSYAQAVNSLASLAAEVNAGQTQQPLVQAGQLPPALDAGVGQKLGADTADAIFGFLDAHCYFQQLEELDPMHISEYYNPPTHHSAPALSSMANNSTGSNTAGAAAAPAPSGPWAATAGQQQQHPHHHVAHIHPRHSHHQLPHGIDPAANAAAAAAAALASGFKRKSVDTTGLELRLPDHHGLEAEDEEAPLAMQASGPGANSSRATSPGSSRNSAGSAGAAAAAAALAAGGVAGPLGPSSARSSGGGAAGAHGHSQAQYGPSSTGDAMSVDTCTPAVPANGAWPPPQSGTAQGGPSTSNGGGAGAGAAQGDGGACSLKRAKSTGMGSPLTHSQMFARIAKLYESGPGALPLSDQDVHRLQKLRAELDRATCGWLSAGAALLPAVSQEAGWRGCKVTHCIVSTGQLVATLGKLLLFGLSENVKPEDVYSASKLSKLAVFKRVRQRFGVQVQYLAVGDGAEEKKAAEAMHWPFVQISLAGRAATILKAASAAGGGAAIHSVATGSASVSGSEGPEALEVAHHGDHGDGSRQVSCDMEVVVEPPSRMVVPPQGGLRISEVDADLVLDLALSGGK